MKKTKRLADTRITIQYRTRTGLVCELVSYREKVVVHIFCVDEENSEERWHVEAHEPSMPEAQLEGCGANAASALVILASAWMARDGECLFDWDAAAVELRAVRAI